MTGGARGAADPRHLLAIAALVLGIGAALTRPAPRTSRPARAPRPASIDIVALAAEISREADHVTALELAEWIRERRPGLRVLDVRSEEEYATYHVPSAERLPLESIATLWPRTGETLVLYSEGGAHAAQAWVLLRAAGFERVYFLRGGIIDWVEDVMSPANPDEHVSALSRYFGGAPRAGGAGKGFGGAVPLPTAGNPRPSAAAVERVRRRGC